MAVIQSQMLKPGMVTAAPVLTRNGQLIVNEGIELDARLIARLEFYSIKSASIVDSSIPKEDSMQDEIPDEPVKEPETEKEEPDDTSQFMNAGNATYSQKLKRSDQFRDFQLGYTKGIMDLRNSFKLIGEGELPDVKQMLSSSMKVLNEHRMNTLELFDMLHNMRTVDDSVYAHCINVSYIARILGMWLKFTPDQVDDLTVAGLLHDIGKTMIPEPILKKPGKLSDSEYAIVKMHPQFGYDMLKDKGLPDQILNAVLNHHERCDGSGYPNHLVRNDLDDFSMVIAVADVYDAMTAARSYRAPMCPFAVIASFEDEGLQKYKPHVILTFLERIANTHQNSRVMLSDGSKGTIVMLNNSHLSRPIVKLENGDFVDLSMKTSLSITSLL
ncbi:MAG: HD-GYP domain-containing protein [Lachnospiraceae bacterium]